MIQLVPEKCIGYKLCVKACLFGGIAVDGKVPRLTDSCTDCTLSPVQRKMRG